MNLLKNLNGRPRWLSASAVFFVLTALLVGFATVAVAASPSPAASDSPAAGASALPGDPAKGQALYNSSGCAACHGANLEGGIGAKLNPIENLGNTSNPKDPDYIIGVIANGLQGAGKYQTAMPIKGNATKLGDLDIKDLAAYIIKANETLGPPPLSAGELAKSTITWVTIGILTMVLLTWGLSQYNMRWIARKVAARRSGGRV